MNDPKVWLMALSMIASASAWLYTWIAQRRAATAKDAEEMGRKITLLEERLRHVPSSDLVNALHSDMKGVQARLDGIQQSLMPLSMALDRINQYLLNHK